MLRFSDWIRDRHQAWERSYRAYARFRSFHSFNDWRFHRRGFFECWAEPGFHRFWQVWNPGISCIIYRLFIRLGGRRRWVLPTVASFLICGLAHTLIVFPFIMRWSYTIIVTFAFFGILTVLSRYLAAYLHQERWPAFFNIAVHLSLVAASFEAGFRANRWLC